MTRYQAKRQAAIHEAMSILCQQQADLDRELGREEMARLAEESAADHVQWQHNAERIACSTH